MNKKILVAYASRHGSTAEVAGAIGEIFVGRGWEVDVLPAAEVEEATPYQAAVIGSAIRMGHPLGTAVKLLKNQRVKFERIPVAYFALHILNLENSPAAVAARKAYLKPLRDLVQPRAEACFAGRAILEEMSFGERLLSKMVKGPIGDLRDWTAIRAWAGSLPPLFSAAAQEAGKA